MRLLLSTALLALVPASAAAQQQAVGVDVQVSEVRKLTVRPGAGVEVIDGGFAVRDGAMVLRVTANVEWRIEVASAAAESLEVSADDAAYTPVSATWQPVAAGSRGRDQEIILDLRRSGTAAPDADDVLVRIVSL